MVCYLCRERFSYYTKHVLPDEKFVKKFLPDFKLDSDNLCEKCYQKFRAIFDCQYPRPPSLIDGTLHYNPMDDPMGDPLTPEEQAEQDAQARKRIIDEIKKSI